MKNLPYIILTTLPFLLSCNAQSGEGSQEKENVVLPAETKKVEIRVDTLTADLEVPWGIAFLSDGDFLITERSGSLRIFHDGKLLEEPVKGVPRVRAGGQGGMLDVEAHPDYENNGWLYLSYSAPGENGGNTAVMRAKIRNGELIDKEVIFRAKPDFTTSHHYGCKLQFDRNNYLFFGVGDRGHMENAQKLDNHSGKVLRLHDDGRIPENNPFVGDENALPEIYSYGHRNPQGMALHPQTGMIWEHEHGPQGGDEVNIIQEAKNYGWPEITYGINYDNSIISEDTAKAGMEQPVLYWDPSIAPCGMTFVTGDNYPGWKGDLLVGSLKFRYLSYCDVEGNQIVGQEKLLEGVGRIRDVSMSPDGYIYVLTEAPGMLLRLTPKNEI